MKYMLKLGILIVILLTSQNVKSQSGCNIEISEGFLFYNYFKDSRDVNDVLIGFGIQSRLRLSKNFQLNKSNSYNIGIGYSGFLNLDNSLFIGGIHSTENYSLSSYLNFSLGYNFAMTKKIRGRIMSSNYLLLNIVNKGDYHRHFFSTIDFGFVTSINGRFSMSVTTPLSILPMYEGTIGIFGPNGLDIIDFWVELVGVNIGVIYNFGI